MSILDQIKKTEALAPRITIYGAPGIGKSTLASQFDDCLFLLTEQSGLLDIDAIAPPATFEGMWDNVKQLLKEESLTYKTIVVDSVSKLDQLIIERILSKEKPRKDGTIASTLATACGGYGAGFQAAALLHKAFKELMDRFQSKGITVVYIGHLASVKYKAPDLEDFDRYSIVMNGEKSREPYIDDVDCVLFCKLKSYVSEADSGRSLIRSSTDRVILPGVSDGHISKNRFNMPNEIPMDIESIYKYIPFYLNKGKNND